MDIVARAKGETNVSEIVKYLEWKAEEEQVSSFRFAKLSCKPKITIIHISIMTLRPSL